MSEWDDWGQGRTPLALPALSLMSWISFFSGTCKVRFPVLATPKSDWIERTRT